MPGNRSAFGEQLEETSRQSILQIRTLNHVDFQILAGCNASLPSHAAASLKLIDPVPKWPKIIGAF